MKTLIFLTIAAATAITPSLWRDGDRLQPPVSRESLAISNVDSASKTARVEANSFHFDKAADIIVYQSGDTLYHVQDATKHICLVSSDTLSYLGFENRATRLALDSPLTVLRCPPRDGDIISGEWTGTVYHRGRTLLRKVTGRSTSRVEKGWRIITDGDTLHDATLLRWELGMAFYHPDSLGTEIPDTLVSPSVSDLTLPTKKLISGSMLTLREIWFAPSARYPLLQRSVTCRVTSADGTPADTVPLSRLAMFYPQELQRIDTGEEYALLTDDDEIRELSSGGSADDTGGYFPLDIDTPRIKDGSVTVSVCSPGGRTEARLTLFSVAGIQLSETVTVDAVEIPRTITVHAPGGTAGIVLLRVDAGEQSRTYKTAL